MRHMSLFSILVVTMRILFGIGWLLAGVTKITEKLWYTEPGTYLKEYLLTSLDQTNVPDFYKVFIENVALDYVVSLSYLIPLTQIALGILLILGLFTLPSILICLFMHVNFLLSGNINLISIVLYTSAFLLIIFNKEAYQLSLDGYFKIDQKFRSRMIKKTKKHVSPYIHENEIPRHFS